MTQHHLCAAIQVNTPESPCQAEAVSIIDRSCLCSLMAQKNFISQGFGDLPELRNNWSELA